MQHTQLSSKKGSRRCRHGVRRVLVPVQFEAREGDHVAGVKPSNPSPALPPFFSIQCVSQSFLLKVVSTNADGSASVVTSVPCSAGSANELCMVEVCTIFAPDEDMAHVGQGM